MCRTMLYFYHAFEYIYIYIFKRKKKNNNNTHTFFSPKKWYFYQNSFISKNSIQAKNSKELHWPYNTSQQKYNKKLGFLKQIALPNNPRKRPSKYPSISTKSKWKHTTFSKMSIFLVEEACLENGLWLLVQFFPVPLSYVSPQITIKNKNFFKNYYWSLYCILNYKCAAPYW